MILGKRLRVGIHLDRDRMFAVLMRFRGRFKEVVQHAELPAADGYLEGDGRPAEEAAARLAEVMEQFGAKRTPVDVVAHVPSLLIRTFDLPAMSERELGKALVYEVPRRVVLPAEEFLSDCVPVQKDGGWTVIAVSVHKAVVERIRKFTLMAGIRRCRLDIEPFAAWRVVPGGDRLSETYLMAAVTESQAMICVWEGRVLHRARYVRVEDWDVGRSELLEQMRLTWQYGGSFSGGPEGAPASSIVVLGGRRAAEVAHFLEEAAGVRAIVVDPTAQVVCRTADSFHRVKEAGLFAMGAALSRGGFRVAT